MIQLHEIALAIREVEQFTGLRRVRIDLEATGGRPKGWRTASARGLVMRRLVLKGHRRSDVARAIGVHYRSVCRWTEDL